MQFIMEFYRLYYVRPKHMAIYLCIAIAMNDRTLKKWVIKYACLCVYYYYKISMSIVISCYHMKTVVINQGQIYRLNINITYIL